MGIETAIALSAVGAATTAVGQYSASQARSQRAQTNAKLARIESQRQEQRAQLQREIGLAEARRRARQGEAQVGAARAAAAASGVQVTGTTQDAIADVALEAELNEDLAMFESEIRAQELERGAARSLTEASALESRAQAAQTAGTLRAGGTLLSAAGQAAGRIGGGGSGGGTGGGTSAGLGGETGFGINTG